MLQEEFHKTQEYDISSYVGCLLGKDNRDESYSYSRTSQVKPVEMTSRLAVSQSADLGPRDEDKPVRGMKLVQVQDTVTILPKTLEMRT